MKKTMIFALVLAMVGIGAADAKYVRGHYRKSTGSYVSGYHRTRADRVKFNNYSTRGNRNPYTGKKGYKRTY